MRHGISAAALIVQDARILLVNHKETGRYDVWLPPGGRLKGSESIFERATRETQEDTGPDTELRASCHERECRTHVPPQR